MLTDYLVTCPYRDCKWSGSLLPEGDRKAWLSAVPSVHDVTFVCPKCHREWHAEVVGDDVKPLPVSSPTPGS